MRHDILKDFPGSQDGRFTEQFRAGTQADLSDYLAGIVVPLGWARPVKPAQASLPGTSSASRLDIDNKAVATDGSTAPLKRGKSK